MDFYVYVEVIIDIDFLLLIVENLVELNYILVLVLYFYEQVDYVLVVYQVVLYFLHYNNAHNNVKNMSLKTYKVLIKEENENVFNV